MLRRRTSSLTTIDVVKRQKTESPDEAQASCGITLIRTPIMDMLTYDQQQAAVIFQPYSSPLFGHVNSLESRKMTLGTTRRRKGTYIPAFVATASPEVGPPLEAPVAGGMPLVLWKRKDDDPPNYCDEISVDPMLTRWLREHQRLGVQFLFDCIMGEKEALKALEYQNLQGNGCILADDMGLGKTLQSISLMWTLLKQGFVKGRSTIKKAVVVCPASLVKNWGSEIDKWLEKKCGNTPVAEGSKDKVVSAFAGFKYDRQSLVLISSYETFRAHVDKLDGCDIDLVICDEAHRLKNDKTKTSIAIMNMKTRRRLLLSGTPIQNDLEEFYSLVSLCNPEILGDPSAFKKRFEQPILVGREPGASQKQQETASERLTELSNITNTFILRRTNALLAKVLPPKVVMNVFCKLTEEQEKMYDKILLSKECQAVLGQDKTGGGNLGKVLSLIQSLMKLCNHPALLNQQKESIKNHEEHEQAMKFNRDFDYKYSGKLHLVARLLKEIRAATKDKIVLISNYTQTLDLFERICKELALQCLRLDGTTPIKKRHALVTKFNDPSSPTAVFLLSSKAGGCGINLIGGNRLVMFDPDWNPANDKQALARVWRDGQKKTCYVYRLFSTGTIEEKIFQRQICKDGLSEMVCGQGDAALKDSLSAAAIKNLFSFKKQTLSDTHSEINCTRCNLPEAPSKPKPTLAKPKPNGKLIQVLDSSDEDEDEENDPPANQKRAVPKSEEDGSAGFVPQFPDFKEEDLNTWAHHIDPRSVPDEEFVAAVKSMDAEETRAKDISFVMSCRIEYISSSQET